MGTRHGDIPARSGNHDPDTAPGTSCTASDQGASTAQTCLAPAVTYQPWSVASSAMR